MKHLFKNSFFSFLKNKTGVFLLMFIVFLTSASFTMFNSANDSFKRSYDSVMENGQRHDYTIKELYDLSGQANFKAPEKVTGANSNYDKVEVTTKTGVTSALPAQGDAGMVTKDGIDYFVFIGQSTDVWNGNIPVLIYIKPADLYSYLSSAISNLPAHAYYDPGFGSLIGDEGIGMGGKKTEVDLSDVSPAFSYDAGLGLESHPIDLSFKSMIKQSNYDKLFNSPAAVSYQRWNIPMDDTSKDIFKEAHKSVDSVFSLKASDGNNFDSASFTYNGNLGKIPTYNKLKEVMSQKIYTTANELMHKKLMDILESKNSITEKVIYKDIESLKVNIGTSVFKAVKGSDANVDTMKIYEGSKFAESKDEATLKQELAMSMMTQGETTLAMDIMQGKKDIQYDGYKVYYSNFQRTYSVVDSTSYQAVISPTYASKNNIKSISKETLTNILNNNELQDKLHDQNVTFDETKKVIENVAKMYGASKSLIYIGSTPVFVTGIGITPDFAFPIISQDVAVPNSNNQAIIYLNNAGYHRIKDANPGSDTENYIALKFTDDATEADRADVVNSVNEFANRFMSWPKGINAIEKYDSSDESVLMAPTRITFLDKISGAVSKISWIVTSVLLAFASFIVILVVRKQIDTRKKELGILMANGYSKSQVSVSMMMLSIMVVVIPAALGYLTGHFFQFILIDIFRDYWTLPVWETQWSWITFTLVIGLPLVGMGIIAYLISLWSLRGTIPEILNGASVSKAGMMNGVSRSIKFLGIKTKMAVSTTISNIGKITIGMVAFTATLISLSISFNSVDKFDVAANRSQQAREYKYEVDLVTPTDEAGLYSRQTLDSIYYDSQSVDGMKDSQGVQHKVDKINKVRTISDIKRFEHVLDDFNGNSGVASFNNLLSFHSPSADDATFAWSPTPPTGKTTFVDYLRNRIQIKSLLDTNVTGQINPWQIASQMMPENQKNKAELASANFIDQTYNWLVQGDRTFADKLRTEGIVTINPVTQKWQANRLKSIDIIHTTLKPEYKQFIIFGLVRASQEYYLGNKNIHIPLMLTYHSIVTDNTDETYTHIDINSHLEDIKGNQESKDIRIRGIDLDKLKSGKSMIKMSSDSISALETNSDLTNVVPIVINKYISEFYKLHNGSIINGTIENMSSRYKEVTKPTKRFKVVGIEDTYDDGRFYTLKSYANKTIGLDKLLSSNSMVKTEKDIFNGVFSKEDNPLIFRTSPIYAESGLYLGKNTTDMKPGSKDEQYAMMKEEFFGPLSVILGKTFPNPRVKSMDDIKSIYGVGDYLHPLNSAYNAVEAANISAYQFNSIMDLSSALMNTIQGITMVISLAFVLLIATMIIADNKKFISTLKVMGYRNREISRIFISTFIPALIVAVVIALPLSFGILELIRIGIMNFGHVLIPLHMMGWEMVAAFGVLILGLGTMWWISSRGLKNTSLLQAFNE